jgi:hypothetical protein
MSQHITILADLSDEGQCRKYVFMPLEDLITLLQGEHDMDSWDPRALASQLRPCLGEDEPTSEIIIGDGGVENFLDDYETWWEALRRIRQMAGAHLDQTGAP